MFKTANWLVWAHHLAEGGARSGEERDPGDNRVRAKLQRAFFNHVKT
jgi:hypothetical protein